MVVAFSQHFRDISTLLHVLADEGYELIRDKLAVVRRGYPKIYVRVH